MTWELSEREAVRHQARRLLDERAAADALASYYALHAPAARAEVFTQTGGEGAPEGFIVRARTGMDLFRPLVTYRARTEAAARALFAAGLPPGRPVYLTVPLELAPWANKYLTVSGAEPHRLYQFRADRYQPLINVLTVTTRDPGGAPRCEIRTGEQLGAVAGVNWQSPRFAEVYVYTEPAVRGRGWGKSVVSTLVGLLLQTGRTPLYVVSENNDYSIRLAEAVGFEDTGHREFVAQAVREPSAYPNL
ncbi:MAG: GNAT family N-acetyltransferase [Anaerolineales bacterium]|nr:GNAT family N-acetyltransferase [Anaerolineales bacterium]